MKKLLLSLGIALAFTFAVSQASAEITPISQVRQNDENGESYLKGETVTLTGVVTVANEFGGTAYIQDATAGVAIYDKKFAGSVAIGDSVILTGLVTMYQGLTEIGTLTSSSIVANGCAANPTVVTIAQVKGQAWDGFEQYEGALLRINKVWMITTSPTGKWAGGTNYKLTDGIDTMDMRINATTNIVGQPVSKDTFDLIGALGYYTAVKTPPWSDPRGYQIMPRFITDILSDKGPIIMPPVTLSGINPIGFTANFTTARAGTTGIKYWDANDNLVGFKQTDESTTTHSITAFGLQPSTQYYYQVFSVNNDAESRSEKFPFVTPSDNPQQGTVNVYFNGSVDKTVAIKDNEAKGDAKFADLLISRINSSVYSLDMAIYSLDNAYDISNAIISAKDRGVKVRVVVNHDFNASLISDWTSKGIKISRRTDSIMHNKFIVTDGRDENKLNDWVWTGSWNLSSANSSLALNNVVEINDYALARAYTQEFEEMWGSDTEDPNPENAKFGASKTDNTQHFFSIGGRDVRCYFSPSDGTETYIKNEMTSADSTIYFSQYAFTSSVIGIEISNRIKNQGVKLRGIFDDTTGSQAKYWLSNGEVFNYRKIAPAGGIIHHKYGIVDASYLTSKPTVITGSHNWSGAANSKNDENTLIISDALIANQYMQEFKKRYNELGGTGDFIVPGYNATEEPSAIRGSFSAQPNPASGISTIVFDVKSGSKYELSIYNEMGQFVATVTKGIGEDSRHAVDFDFSGFATGAYYLVLNADGNRSACPIVVVK